MKRKKKTKSKKSIIEVKLPLDVIAFYKEVAKKADCTLNQAILVVVAIELLKTGAK